MTTSGSGVAFTRNPANGTDEFYGEFLVNAQGEDVVAGVRTPEPVLKLKDVMPKSYAELLKVRKTLEAHFKDVQDIEFTIQEGKLFMLQTRNGKRTAAAALKFATDMVKEKLIDWQTAVTRVPGRSAGSGAGADLRSYAAVKDAAVIATGLPAGPGAASGKIYLNAERAVEAEKRGEKVLLVRVETSPEDLRGMIAAEGILTARGGVSSHAALVARQMGKVCVCGAAASCRSITAQRPFRSMARVSTKVTSFRSTAPAETFTPGRSRPPLRKSSRCWSTRRSTRRMPRLTRCSPS